MNARHVMIPSAAMGRDVHMWKYGSFGLPVVVFPTAAGFAHEWQSHGMVDSLGPLLSAGKIKLYCPESNVAEAWTRKETDPAWRMERHAAYERFVHEDLLPYVWKDCHFPEGTPVACAGASLGGMYAALFALKSPERFNWALCMSGRYLATVFTQGFDSPAVYFNNPLAFVPNLEGEALERTRRTHLVLVCGQGKWEEGCIEETIALANACERKGIPSTPDIWGRDVSHDWAWWRRQAVFHLGKRFGR